MIYRPGVLQNYRFGKWGYLVAHFVPRPEWFSCLHWPEIAPGLMKLELTDAKLRRRVTDRLQDMVRFYVSLQPRNEMLGMNALEEVLLWCDSINPLQISSQIDSRIQKAMEFLSTHLGESFSDENVAHAAGVSAAHLRYLFRRHGYDSPRTFQEKLRMRRAQDLLDISHQTIGEIASEVGYDDPLYFSVRFKKNIGESPRAFRKRGAGHGNISPVDSLRKK